VRLDDGQELDIGPDTAFEIPPGHDKWVVGEVPWEVVEWGGSGRAMEAALADGGTRMLASVLFTDIVDSTERLRDVGDAAWRDLLARHDARLREELSVHRGREVKTTGDGLLAVFDSPTRAVRCAAAMTRRAHDGGIEMRAAVHTGEVETVADDVRGIAVHVAARLLSLGGPGDVILSAATSDLVEGSGLALEDLGEHELKGVGGRRRAFRLATS
jgi:class 3 adenylate cyclase